MKVLITGATGFLGSHLCTRMVAEGYSVRVLCRPTSSVTRIAGLPLEVMKGDLTDKKSIRAAVTGCEYVIHAAANTSSRFRDTELLMKVNVDGTGNVARAARALGARRLLHISSVAAVGISADPKFPANEKFSFNLESSGWAYHLSKRRAEAVILGEVECGLDAVIVNPALICGPSSTAYRAAEPMERALATPILPYSPGGLCLVHVNDVVDGVVRALHKGRTGERYILGGDNVTFRRIYDVVSHRFALPRLLFPVPARLVEHKAEVSRFLRVRLRMQPICAYDRQTCFQFYDSGKAKGELGYHAMDFTSIVEEFARYRIGDRLRRQKTKWRSKEVCVKS